MVLEHHTAVLMSLHEHNQQVSIPRIIERLENGENVAVVSDAGYPLVSDPGQKLVQETISHGFNVVSVSGANAAMNALVASGLSCYHYLFYGFLDNKSSKRKKQLEEIKTIPYTTIFYEAPHRLKKTLKTLAEVIKPDRKIVLARELTKIHEEYLRGTISEINEYFTKNDPRGEFVVLVSPNDEKEKQLSWDELIKQVADRVEAGESKKDAIKLVAKANKVSKNELYDKYHQN